MRIEPSGPSDRARPRLVASIVAVAFFMQMLDGTIIVTSLPAMAADFGTDEVALNVGFTAYLLALAVFIAPAGWLAERFGARRVFLLATIGFTIASAACAAATSLETFTFARLVQGATAALMAPVGRQIVLRNTPKTELVQAIALITWPALVAPVVGPILGGFITTHFGWRWNFLINLPIGLVGGVLIHVFLDKDETSRVRRFDWEGLALSSLALSGIVVGLELYALADGIGPASSMLGGGLLLGVLAVRHLQRSAAPLVDLDVLRVQTFALSTLTAGAFSRTAINATPFLLPLLLQVGYGLDPLETGSLILVYFLGNLAMKPATTAALRRFGFRSLLVGNGLMASALVAGFALLDPGSAEPFLFTVLFAAGLSRSMQFTALNTIAFADVEANQRGAAATLSAMSQQLSQLLAVAGSIAVVRLADRLLRPDEAAISFALAFAAMGAVGVVASLAFLRLPTEAGAEVSRQRRQV